ncbi:MAG: hypothetical protein MZW92_39170 [Comamonadaceae bacterium]|nr:hypothetical protein [Comamonadaceae bacterium]
MISTIGRTPRNEAPIARPVKPFSEIGVSITRSGAVFGVQTIGRLVGAAGDADVFTHADDQSDHVAISSSWARLDRFPIHDVCHAVFLNDSVSR